MKKMIVSAVVMMATIPTVAVAVNRSCVNCLIPSLDGGRPIAITRIEQDIRSIQKKLPSAPQNTEAQNQAGLVNPKLQIPGQSENWKGTVGAAPGVDVRIPGEFDFSTVSPQFQSPYWLAQPTPISQALPRWDGNPFVANFRPVSQLWQPVYVPGLFSGF